MIPGKLLTTEQSKRLAIVNSTERQVLIEAIVQALRLANRGQQFVNNSPAKLWPRMMVV